jgi:hypothetical protein
MHFHETRVALAAALAGLVLATGIGAAATPPAAPPPAAPLTAGQPVDAPAAVNQTIAATDGA